MSMSKKDFIALADALRPIIEGPVMVHETGKPTRTIQDDLARAMADFCAGQNPQFKRDRWLSYLRGECGPSGDAVKAVR
jgi:hypothetical protein